MNKIIKSVLAVLMTASLFGCGSSSSTASEATEETIKEPELKEVEISLDNWQDYFDYDYIPYERESTKNDAVNEDDLGKQFTAGYNLILKLKPEFQDKISQDDISVVSFACDIEFYRVHASYDGKTISFGDVVPYDSNEWEEYLYSTITKDEVLNDDSLSQYFVIADDDMIVQRWSGDKTTFSTEDILNGMVVKNFGFLRKYERLPDGGLEMSLDNETIIGAYFARNIDWKQFEGTLYLYE